MVQLGIRTLLLILAILFFFISLFVSGSEFNWLVAGLICVAGALLVEELGIKGNFSARGFTRTPPPA